MRKWRNSQPLATVVIYPRFIKGSKKEKNDFLRPIVHGILKRYEKVSDLISLKVAPRFNMKITDLVWIAGGKTKRQTMYTEMQQLLRDEGGVIIPAFGMNIAVASSKVKFNSVAPNLELDGLRASQRWWFK